MYQALISFYIIATTFVLTLALRRQKDFLYLVSKEYEMGDFPDWEFPLALTFLILGVLGTLLLFVCIPLLLIYNLTLGISLIVTIIAGKLLLDTKTIPPRTRVIMSSLAELLIIFVLM